MSAESGPLLFLESRSVEQENKLSGLEQNPYTLLSVASARVYHTKLSDQNNQWTYSQWRGKLFFCRDIDNTIPATRSPVNEAEKHWFRLADEETGRTVWMFRFPENFEYAIDRPFFHVFQGRVRSFTIL
jgi:Wiskott-Aldrich syndrome protein